MSKCTKKWVAETFVRKDGQDIACGVVVLGKVKRVRSEFFYMRNSLGEWLQSADKINWKLTAVPPHKFKFLDRSDELAYEFKLTFSNVGLALGLESIEV